MILRGVHSYSAASTDEAAFIIGGYQGSGSYGQGVIEYKDDTWRKVGYLKQGRYNHASISLDEFIMVVGGRTDNG